MFLSTTVSPKKNPERKRSKEFIWYHLRFHFHFHSWERKHIRKGNEIMPKGENVTERQNMWKCLQNDVKSALRKIFSITNVWESINFTKSHSWMNDGERGLWWKASSGIFITYESLHLKFLRPMYITPSWHSLMCAVSEEIAKKPWMSLIRTMEKLQSERRRVCLAIVVLASSDLVWRG